jgi:hypothetical protein
LKRDQPQTHCVHSQNQTLQFKELETFVCPFIVQCRETSHFNFQNLALNRANKVLLNPEALFALFRRLKCSPTMSTRHDFSFLKRGGILRNDARSNMRWLFKEIKQF